MRNFWRSSNSRTCSILRCFCTTLAKARKTGDHVRASVEIAEGALDRLDLDEPDREAVIFLIGAHLEMSAAMRRDIFDPETVRAFAEKVETPERLKMLCLLTYADIKAVNPEALTPVESGKHLAALYRDRESFESQPGSSVCTWTRMTK